MASVPPLVLIGTAVICLGALLNMIGLGTPHWQEWEGSITIQGHRFYGSAHFGLFKGCGSEDCTDIDKPSSALEATRALIILGMLASLAAGATAILYVILNLLSKNAPKLLPIIAGIASLGAFGFIIIGVIVYGAEVHESIGDLGYSFALCIVGAILLAAGAVMTFFGAKSVS